MAEQSHFAQGANEVAQLVAANKTSEVHDRLLLDSQYMSQSDFKSFVGMAAKKTEENLAQNPNAPSLSFESTIDRVFGAHMEYPGKHWGNLTRGIGDNSATVYNTKSTFMQGLTEGFMDSTGLTMLKHAFFKDTSPATQYLEFGPIEVRKVK
jgi:hypothetical protein